MNTKLISAMLGACLLTACAAMTTGKTQPIRLQTFDDAGREVIGVHCALSNADGRYQVVTPGDVLVQKSASDLSIVCEQAGQRPANARLVSRAGSEMTNSFLMGGGIGMLIDHGNGNVYRYPEWVRLVFGKWLSFDRHNERPGQPSFATEQTTAAQ